MPWTTGGFFMLLWSWNIFCLMRQFAYNEVSFFVIRLLQRFSSFSLALDAQVPDLLPPAQWIGKQGPQGRDKIRLGVHLTMYVRGGLWVRMKDTGGPLEKTEHHC